MCASVHQTCIWQICVEYYVQVGLLSNGLPVCTYNFSSDVWAKRTQFRGEKSTQLTSRNTMLSSSYCLTWTICMQDCLLEGRDACRSSWLFCKRKAAEFWRSLPRDHDSGFSARGAWREGEKWKKSKNWLELRRWLPGHAVVVMLGQWQNWIWSHLSLSWWLTLSFLFEMENRSWDSLLEPVGSV